MRQKELHYEGRSLPLRCHISSLSPSSCGGVSLGKAKDTFSWPWDRFCPGSCHKLNSGGPRGFSTACCGVTSPMTFHRRRGRGRLSYAFEALSSRGSGWVLPVCAATAAFPSNSTCDLRETAVSDGLKRDLNALLRC